MKKDIHPTYNTETKVTCACGNEYVVGSTQDKIEVETCSHCHPFYTGAERGALRGGRVEKFQSRVEKQAQIQEKLGGAAKSKTAKRQEKKAKKETEK